MSKRLMIVDDSVFIYEEMKHILKDSDFKIVSYVKTGEAAVGEYEHCQPDVVTMDIILPGMDGIDAAKSILERWPGAKIVMVSSLAYDETIDAANEIGARGFIFKPFEPEELIQALNKAVL